MKIDGQCHCGSIKFEAEVDPSSVTVCHCTDCQQLSGSAFRANIVAASGQFKLLSGSPKNYVKTAASGKRRTQAFCAQCGAQIYSCDAENPDSYSLRIGTIRQRDALTPRKQIWRRSALGWVDRLAGLPSSDGQ